MQSTSLPTPLQTPWASSSALKNAIPQTTTVAGAASWTLGWPSLTMTNVNSGGIPPDGKDDNGVLNFITTIQQWQSAGGVFQYNSTLSAAIGGYPQGALLKKTGTYGFWVSTAENNTTDPDTGGAGWIDFVNAGTIVATTQAQYDNTTAIATDAFVQRALGNLRSINSITTTATLTAAQSGMLNACTGTTYTVTLPACGFPNAPIGTVFNFVNLGTGTVSIAANSGSDTLRFSGTKYGIAGPILLTSGATLELVSDGVHSWTAKGGSATLQYADGLFGSNLAMPGYQEFPGGFIDQWINGSGQSTESAQIITLPVALTKLLNVQISTVAASGDANADAIWTLVNPPYNGSATTITCFLQGMSGTDIALVPSLRVAGVK